MNDNSVAFLLVLGLFLGMLRMLTLGQRLGRRSLAQEADVVRSRLTGVETAIFGLLGLMIFTFSGAAARYELRRQLIVEEGNAIGTAYLRLDLLPVRRNRRCGTNSGAMSQRESLSTVFCPISMHRT